MQDGCLGWWQGVAACAGAALMCGGTTVASVVWNGPTTTFVKASFADPALAENQDRVTPSVWISRGATQGLFNAHTELFFTHLSSPSGTEWADGTLSNYSELVYSNWETWATSHFGGPPATVGVPAVVHLIEDDVYLSLTFTSWASLGGGGFSYERSTVPSPASLAVLGCGGVALTRRRRG